MYVVIRRYEDASSRFADEGIRLINEGLLPILSQVPGFVAYYAFDAGGGVVSSVSIFEDQAGAEESNRRAADWVQQNVGEMVPNPPQVTAGQVLIHRAK